MTRPARPEWWPRCSDGEEWPLLTLIYAIQRERGWMAKEPSDDPNRPAVRRIALYVRALSHACRNWISPSTPYEHALYRLCLAAIDEAQSTSGNAAEDKS